jgi:replicative DNA helicase
MDKPLPHDVTLEKIVLGTVLIEPSIFDIVRKYLTMDSFYIESHKLIFWTFEQILKKSQYIDVALVINYLKEIGKIEQAGGSFNIAQLMDLVGTSSNIEVHSRIVAEMHMKRSLIQTCQKTISEVFENPDINEVFGKCSAGIDDIFNMKSADTVYLGKIMDTRINQISKLDKEKIIGIASGLRDMDENYGGWQNGDFIVIAARPSMGKTAVSLYFAKYPVINQGKRILYFSLEVPGYRLADRILSFETGINSKYLQTGRIQDKDWLTLYDVADKYNNHNFVINDESGLTIEDIIAISIMENRKFKIDMVIIDYLQLINYTFKDGRTENSQVGHISRNCKKLAKRLNIPVIALSQLNRGVESRANKKPELSDLRDSGSIEQDADVVGMLYRDDAYNKNDSLTPNVIEIDFKKHRNGETGVVKLYRSPDWSYLSDTPQMEWIEQMPRF